VARRLSVRGIIVEFFWVVRESRGSMRLRMLSVSFMAAVCLLANAGVNIRLDTR
jgi:hypothetical protein